METPRNSDNYDISIHALRKESDLAGIGFCGLTSWLFQSTLSVRRATLDDFLLRLLVEISIHALRKESDSCR